MEEHVSLKPLTTFEIGGSALYFTEVCDEDEVRDALAYAHGKDLEPYVLAGGSNVLVPDEGIASLVLHFGQGAYKVRSLRVYVQAGMALNTLIKELAATGLGGFESLAGIPGSVGGAVRGNAGAFGTEIKDVLKEVRALNCETGEVRTFTAPQCRFNYRASYFKRNPSWIILDAVLQLQPTEVRHAMKRVEDTIAEREKRHLQNVRAAGSFFTNPVVSASLQKIFSEEKGSHAREGCVPAGWLIEKAKMRGVCVGGACMSEQHANYLINNGNATAGQVHTLARQVEAAVEKETGVVLEREVTCW